MILGVFNGNTHLTLSKRLEALKAKQDRLKNDIHQAIADRTAALSEIKADIENLAALSVAV